LRAAAAALAPTLWDQATMAEEVPDIKVVHSDMNEEMVADLVTVVKDVFKKGVKAHKDIASHVKRQYDIKHPPLDNKATSGVFHCIVGTNFACSVTHETHFACQLKAGNVNIVRARPWPARVRARPRAYGRHLRRRPAPPPRLQLIFRSKDSPFD